MYYACMYIYVYIAMATNRGETRNSDLDTQGKSKDFDDKELERSENILASFLASA